MFVIKDGYAVGQILYIDISLKAKLYFGLGYVLLVATADNKIRMVNK